MKKARILLIDASKGHFGAIIRNVSCLITRADVRSHYRHCYGTRINAISAPVFNAQGRMLLTITVVGPASRFDVDRDSQTCQPSLQAAATLSRRLGFQP